MRPAAASQPPDLGRPCRATPSQALAVPCRACFRSLGAAARLPRRVRRRSRRRMGAITLRWHAGGTRGRLRGSRGQRQTDSAARHQAGRPGAASRTGRARGAQRRASWYAGDLERTRRFDQIAINPRLFRTPRRIGSFDRMTVRSNGGRLNSHRQQRSRTLGSGGPRLRGAPFEFSHYRRRGRRLSASSAPARVSCCGTEKQNLKRKLVDFTTHSSTRHRHSSNQTDTILDSPRKRPKREPRYQHGERGIHLESTRIIIGGTPNPIAIYYP